MARKIVLRTLSAIYGVSALFLIIYIRQHTNIFQMDFSGQIASAQLFANNGLHGRSMNWFSGLINNLFYPPLQDFIVYIIHLVGGLTVYHAFLVYLTLLIVAYFGSFVLIASRFKKRYLILLYGIGGLMFLWLAKFPNILFLQGLGVVDITFTGLITEILGGAFLQLILYELLGKKRSLALTIFACLAFLSHLVVGPVAVLIVFLYFAFHRPSNWIRYIAGILGLTAFFWIPFISYKGLLSNSTIIINFPEGIIVMLLASIFFADRKSPTLLVAIVGMLILLPPEINNILPAFGVSRTDTLPSFHYYRLGAVGALLTLYSVVGSLYHYSTTKLEHKNTKKFISYILGISGVVFIVYLRSGYGGMSWRKGVSDQLGSSPQPTQTDLGLMQNLDRNKKILTIDVFRPGDAGLDSLDQFLGYQNNFVKGLFWESSKTNQLLASYLGTLLAPQNIAINYSFLGDLNSTSYNGLWDHFVDDYSIGYILMIRKNHLGYMTPNTNMNLTGLIASGTTNLSFYAMGDIKLNNHFYTLYRIDTKTGSMIRNTMASVVSTMPEQLTIDTTQTFFARDILMKYNNNISLRKAGFKQYLVTDATSTTPPPAITPSSGDLEVYQKDNATYRLVLAGATSARIQIKTAPLPGWHIEDEKGNKIQTYSLPYGMYANISGTVYLVYERTWIMQLGYVISILSAVAMGYLLYIRPRIYKNRK